MKMFALRISKHNNKVASGKPDGMFIRKDGRLTDHKPNGLLFESEDKAFDYGVNWKKTTPVEYSGNLYLVQVSVKPILHVVEGVKCLL